jgi:hypothetical protein
MIFSENRCPLFPDHALAAARAFTGITGWTLREQTQERMMQAPQA